MLAMKRNMGHASASSIILGLEAGLDFHAVYKWERMWGSTLVSAARAWYQDMYRMVNAARDANAPGV